MAFAVLCATTIYHGLSHKGRERTIEIVIGLIIAVLIGLTGIVSSTGFLRGSA